MLRDQPLPPDVAGKIASAGEVLRACPEVVFAYLFGSSARGELTPFSDVDFALYLDLPRCDSVAARLEAAARLTRHLGTDRVDVVLLNSAPASLLGRILRDRVVILDRDPHRRHAFESKALRESADFRIVERRILERRFGRG